MGCGTIGERHAQLAIANGQLLAVCDITAKRAQLFSKRFECYGYTSLHEMLKCHYDADVLIVCTPNGMHAAHSIAGLKNGLHVLCEKPMALTVKDAREMLSAAKKVNKCLVIVKQNRFNPPVLAVKQLLDKKKLGTIYSIQVNCFWNRNNDYYRKSKWRGTWKMDGGILFTQFSHFIDILWWLFGDIKEVKGFVSNRAHQKLIEIDDTGTFCFTTKSCIPGTLHVTTNSFKKNLEGSITLFAEKGTLKIGGAYLNEITYQLPEAVNESRLQKSNQENSYKGYNGSMNNHRLVYDAFLKTIGGNAAGAVTGEEGLKSVQIIEKFYKAAQRL